jgi:CTP synthase
VLNLKRANSREFDQNTPDAVIDMMESQQSVTQMGASMRLGSYPCNLRPGSLAARLYRKLKVNERHRHRYEVNNDYRQRLADAGLIATGAAPDDTLVEIMELKGHKWFLGCQFHPELRSRPLDCHPLFRGLIQAALARRAETAPARSKVRELRSAL